MNALQVKLITHTYTIDSIGQRVPTDVETTVWANKSSISGREFNEASVRGIQAEMRVDVWTFEYNGATEVVIDNIKYSVYRTYNKDGKTELYLEKRV